MIGGKRADTNTGHIGVKLSTLKLFFPCWESITCQLSLFDQPGSDLRSGNPVIELMMFTVIFLELTNTVNHSILPHRHGHISQQCSHCCRVSLETNLTWYAYAINKPTKLHIMPLLSFKQSIHTRKVLHIGSCYIVFLFKDTDDTQYNNWYPFLSHHLPTSTLLLLSFSILWWINKSFEPAPVQ